jgi:uncharacterized protein (DUF2249 family)
MSTATTSELPQLDGFLTYQGMQVCTIGEDGDIFVALGHHDPRHALSAFNAMAKNLLGWMDLTDGDGTNDPKVWKAALARVETAWTVLKYRCDDADDAEHDPDCSECLEIAEAGWWLDWYTKCDAPGAFPVMFWRL